MRRIGRYVLCEQIAAGGMASVHLGRIEGDEGFRRTVAIKQLHPHLASTPEMLEMFVDEAQLSSRVRHRNVVTTLDVVRDGSELFLVMEYVHGVPLSAIQRRLKAKDKRVPIAIASAIVIDTLIGLGAVHATTDEQGRNLHIVHRDVSPQNILVGADGTSRLLDFGIAKAAVRLHTTRDDRLKGKLHYMAPEQILDEAIDGRVDQFAAGIVLWGILTGDRLFEASSEAAVLSRVLEGVILPPGRYRADVPAAVDAVVARALKRPRAERYGSCEEMAAALREAQPPASPEEVRAWALAEAADLFLARDEVIARVEAGVPSVTHRSMPNPILPEGKESATSTAPAGAVPTARPAPEAAESASTPTSKRARSPVFPAAAGILIAAAVAIVWLRAHPDTPAAAAVPAPTASQVAAPSAVREETPPTPVQAALPAATSSTPAPSASPAHPGPRRAAKPSTSGRPQCNPMYYTDASGIQRVKPECL